MIEQLRQGKGWGKQDKKVLHFFYNKRLRTDIIWARVDCKYLDLMMEIKGVDTGAVADRRCPCRAWLLGQVLRLHVYNQDGTLHMLQLKVIGIACFLLFFFSFAVYAMVKVTERENKKN